MIEINGTIIAQIVNFLIILAIITKFAYKPLMQVLEERQAKIAKDISDAEKERLQAEELKRDYQKQLADAQKKSQQIIDAALKQAETLKGEILAEAKAEQGRMIENAMAEIAREQKQAVKEIRAEIASMVMLSTEAVLKRNITEADNKKFVQDFLTKLEKNEVGGIYVN